MAEEGSVEFNVVWVDFTPAHLESLHWPGTLDDCPGCVAFNWPTEDDYDTREWGGS